MIRYFVAIVEDEKEIVQELTGFFEQYARENLVEFEIRSFAGGEEFLSQYQPVYHLVLMDIGLPGMDGMETAVRLREKDQSVMLIFVTNMTQYAIRGYEVDAFDYILKPVSYPRLAIKLKRALCRLEGLKDSELVLSLPEGVRRVPTSQIRYIEIEAHTIRIHANEGTWKAYGSLRKLEEQLNNRRFVRCNSCYLVNLAYVKGVADNQVQVGEDFLQMSRPRKKAFLQALNDYLGGGIV